MKRNVVRLFDLYSFFSVFLPGFAFLLGIVPLLPRGVPTGAVSALVPLLVLGFVVGQAIHSLAVWAEEAFGHERHRVRFGEELEGRTNRFDETLVQEFYSCYSDSSFEVPLVSLDEDEDTEESFDYSTIYALVQSYVHATEAGRSRVFQAIYALCRSLWFGSFLLLFLYWFVASYAVIVNAEPRMLLLTAGHLFETLLLFTVGCGFAIFVFKYAADQYQEHFVQYLLADFIVLSRGYDDE